MPLTPGGAEAEPAADTTVEVQAPVSVPPMAAPLVAGPPAAEPLVAESPAAEPPAAAPGPLAAPPPPAQESAPAESEIASVASLVPPPPVATPAHVPRVYGRGNADSRIEIRATQESWVQVTSVDDELLLTRKLYPGDVYRVPNRSGLILMTGNAGALEIAVDGKPAPPLGPLGEVRRDIPLDAEKLLAGLGAAL